MADFRAVTAVSISGAFVFGMVLALLGSIKLPLAKRLGIDEMRVGTLLAALNLAMVPMMLLSGLLIDTFGARAILAIGSTVVGLAILGLTLRRDYPTCLACICLTGLGGSCVSTGSIVLMPQAFQPLNATAALNLGNVFFGLGALVTPSLTEVLLRRLDFHRALGLLALLALMPALLAGLGDTAQYQVAAEETGGVVEVLGNRALWLVALVFLLYVPLEWSISTWATTYLTDLGWIERRAAWLLSGFWLAFLASRLLMAFVGLREPYGAWVILGSAVLAALAFGNLAGTSRKTGAAFGLLFLGAALGPVFPTLVGILFAHFRGKYGTAYGLMFATGAIGSLFLPPLIGNVARRRSVQYALRIPMFLCLLLTAAALLAALAL